MNPHKNYLSPKEYEIMTIFWSIDKPLTVSEILQHRKEGYLVRKFHPSIVEQIIGEWLYRRLWFPKGCEGEQSTV